ncbi:MAG: dTMP kinase [Hyphomicrobiales bacterium]|nr:dTMP kinase [Hyphomicrobiales bacterium]
MTPARLITLEGGEGAGKSTVARGLQARLAERAIRSLVTREPGGSTKAEAIREALLVGQVKPYGPFAEAIMFYAARIDHIEKTIRPALARGEWVISDRFADSTRAYQGALGQIDPALLASLERVALAGFRPDITLILDVPVEIGLARAAARRGSGATDRFESEGRGFHARLRKAYLDIAEREPDRCIVLDASLPPDDVLEMAWAAVEMRALAEASHADADTALP